MAREWSLQETKVLVEEHIALKEEEKLESCTASEHWSKVAKKLREKGFYRSHKSCNKRWYRLEQYELQIFSFNIEEGKTKNYWDLTRAERLEYRDKWPQLPSGDGIDKEMFDLLKNFSHQYEKKEKVEPTIELPICVDNKDLIHAKPNIEINRQSAPPPPPAVALTPRVLPHTIVASGEEQSKLREESLEAQKPSKTDNWPPVIVQPPQSSPGALDGFKLQARELRRRRAAEFRKNNRTVPYNSSHTTFTKVTQPVGQPSLTESTTFGSITVIPPPDSTTGRATNEKSSENLPKDHTDRDTIGIQTKPPIQFKRLFNPSPNQASENLNKSNNPTHPPSIGGHLNFQSPSANASVQQQGHHALGQGKHLLQSINSHVPLLQPKDNHFSHPNSNKNGSANDDRKTLVQELLHLGSLEEQLQVILDVHCGPLQNCEQLQKKNTDDGGRNGSHMLDVAIGGLGVQLGAVVKLLQAKHAAEQEFREKMLVLGECMVVSLRSVAQTNVHTSG